MHCFPQVRVCLPVEGVFVIHVAVDITTSFVASATVTPILQQIKLVTATTNAAP